MSGSDHLDKETALSASLTPTGLEAKAQSRFISAVDRLGGNMIELANVWIEEGVSRRRAKIDGERALIEATAKYGIERLGNDTEFAGRAFDVHFRKIASAQINRDAVLEAAAEDLHLTPPETVDASNNHDSTLSGPFLERFDQYASGASTDELRERWGRVLAAEIRRPGIFSNKVLRTIDEIDAVTAQLFERVCSHRLANVLPKCLTGEINFEDQMRLTESGLLVEPGLGQHRNFNKVATRGGSKIWLMPFLDLALSIPADTDIPDTHRFNENDAIFKDSESLSIPVYVLTEVGLAISSILQDKTLSALEAYCAELGRVLPSTEISKYQRVSDGYVLTGVFTQTATAPQ
ncbi:DUF2806 domain-containing protein [Rhizobium leguminosarum bv. trifolii]|uniref:DUF2806 domain-containing protein n=1 Tax=Rhizobium leguminosarum TaxID=384 RepID=UPI00140FC443|nr:DUF2806 domain-containing protein [Rhizobium leguminosarum]QIO73929.1 DUF2806 domain-containing protein [Rhizobium leguminosarum bv. trifolii]QIO80948.1 DUF2806 domain-containing protein [Rhizobium leguminosarum bv. trifolii]